MSVINAEIEKNVSWHCCTEYMWMMLLVVLCYVFILLIQWSIK